MSAAKTFVQKIDWGLLATKVRPETLASLNAFRGRHQALQQQIAILKDQNNQKIDFAHYKQILKNKTVVENAEKAFTSFSPAKFDITEQNKIISEKESQAVAAAKITADKVNIELKELSQLLQNIETARPVDQLTVDDVANALPEVDINTAKLAKRGQWVVPGYYEKFGEFKVGF